MQIQRRTLLKIANKLYKQGTRIQWKIIDADYRHFADGELSAEMCDCPTICHLNDCSIFVCISSLKLAVLRSVPYIYEFDIICVTETWLKSSVLNTLYLPVFSSPFGFEPNRHGGGVFGLRSMQHFFASIDWI